MAPYFATGVDYYINTVKATNNDVVFTVPIYDNQNTGTLEVTMMRGSYDTSVMGGNNYRTSDWSSYAVSKIQIKKLKRLHGDYATTVWDPYPWHNSTASATITYQWQLGTATGGGWQWVINTNNGEWQSFQRPAAKDLWRIQIKKNLTPSLESRNAFLMASNANPGELRARLLLRDLIGEEEFKRYLIRGFIVVHGKTGIIYKVPGGHETIVSYVKDKEGTYKPFERFCIVFKNQALPHTDSLVMRKLLLETDEFNIRKMSNVSPSCETRPRFDGELFKTLPLLKVAV